MWVVIDNCSVHYYLFKGYLISLTVEQYIVEGLKPILEWN